MPLRTARRRLAKRSTCWGSRVICLVDAFAVRSAYARGRSASVILNSSLRTAMPYMLATGIAIDTLWVPSAENAADDPTRFKKVRAALPLSARAEAALDVFEAEEPRALRFACVCTRRRAGRGAAPEGTSTTEEPLARRPVPEAAAAGIATADRR